jgi:hypothetical protein
MNVKKHYLNEAWSANSAKAWPFPYPLGPRTRHIAAMQTKEHEKKTKTSLSSRANGHNVTGHGVEVERIDNHREKGK